MVPQQIGDGNRKNMLEEELPARPSNTVSLMESHSSSVGNIALEFAKQVIQTGYPKKCGISR